LELIGRERTLLLSYRELVQQAVEAESRAEAARTRADTLAARLRELGIDPDAE
jgi:hypothetical protein